MSEHLNADERLLWSGQPRRGVVLRAQDAFLIPLSLIWTGFAVLMTIIILYAIGNEPLAMIPALFGLVFVSVGLYFLVGRFITDAAGRTRLTTESPASGSSSPAACSLEGSKAFNCGR